MQLVYGVLRQREFLDVVLSLLSRTPLKKLDPFVHQALAVGLLQIFFLNRIPVSAAVNEAVNSCKAAKVNKRLHGFVNGVLRQAIRTKEELQQKASSKKSGEAISNHPDWMVRRWQIQFGKETTAKICAHNNTEPIMTLRVNTTRIKRDSLLQLFYEKNIEAEKSTCSEIGIYISHFSGSITSLPGYREGYFQIQDEAAQLATTLLSPFFSHGNYLDGCAGLGGKTSHLLQELIPQKGHVYAVDPEPFRLKKLQENMVRLFENPPLKVHEASLLELDSSSFPLFNGILIDAPCSGTGVIGRHPDIRWNRTVGDVIKYQANQLALLNHAGTLLKKGGVLVYATCSLEPEENTEVIQIFLAENQDYTLTDCHDFLPKSAQELVRDVFFNPLPSAHMDGFFAARLIKNI